ncbi:MAG: NTP transferase domain-containing protein [Crocinitomicaceae bacterium]|nr:NTP transferase domain-containing protein [Crocinitomicaceae bacterium]
MKIIVPMAGRGSRLRPHTLTVPKPLVPVGGKPIVHRLVEDIAKTLPEKIDEIAFVIGDFGKEVENELIAVAEKLGAKGSIFYQHQALGTAHAVLCAEPCLTGPVVVAFADTLFRADFTLDKNADGILWVSQIEDPSAFGVVTLDNDGNINNFVEKSKTFVSDLAMIGIYYFKDGDQLKHELKYLIDNNIMNGGEYQLPDALKNLTKKGVKFKPGKVTEWLDCGNKEVTVYTNQRVLEFDKNEKLVADDVNLINSVIVPPCYVGKGVVLENSVIGPHVSIGEGTKISNSVISNSIIQVKTSIQNVVLKDSMIGSSVAVKGKSKDYSLGDFSVIEA